MIVGDSWLLHAHRRGKSTEAEESRMLEDFDAKLAPRLLATFQEIARRLDLDYFGVDCNISDDGKVLLFEANACMNTLENTATSPNMWDLPIARIKQALCELLARPPRWLHPAVRQPAAAS